MSGRTRFLNNRLLRGVLVIWLCLISVVELQAAELKIEARLIWGTNYEKIDDPKCKPLDKKLAEKLKKVFTWKKYFEVHRAIATIPSRGKKKLKLSPQCTIDVKELEGPKVEVTLIGEGKPVNKTTYPLSKGESFTIAGDCKDGSAWFILITELDEK